MVVIGIGIDLVDVARVERLLAAKGARAMARLFTEDERAYLATRSALATHAAARIAAKEAVYKGLQSLPGARPIGWRDIEVVRDGAGRPAIRLHGLAARLAHPIEGFSVSLSLSHTAATAGAVALVAAASSG
jgi:holo-[acyl-carrier protein] synthase